LAPEGWHNVSLGAVCEAPLELSTPASGDLRPYVALEHIAQGLPRLLAWSRAEMAGSTKASFKTGDLLFGKLRPNLRKAVRAPFDGICSTDILVLRARPSLISQEFLEHLAHWSEFVRYAMDSASGTRMPRTSWRALRAFEFPLAPLQEQRRIAAILSSIDAATESCRVATERLLEVRRAMLADLLRRGIPGRHKQFSDTSIGNLPASWQVMRYGDLAASQPYAIQSGPFGSALKHSEFAASGVLVIGIDNVLDGRFSMGKEHRITTEKYQSLKRFRARPQDLLITVMATVGRCCVVPLDIGDAIISKHVYRISLNSNLLDSYFAMNCFYGVPSLVDAVRGSTQGLTRPGLNKSLLLPLRLPVPPLAEQREIVDILNNLDRSIDAERKHIDCLCELKAALLPALLTGEIRVPLDVPAS
jgi:type I restriction enzyme S subunit